MLLAAGPIQAAEHLGNYVWNGEGEDFGGFSGLEVGPDGVAFTAISDRASIVQGRIEREDGRIVGVSAGPILRLRARDGTPLPPDARGDSEGLAIGPDGRIHVAFEGDHRIRAYDEPGGAAEDLPANRAFERFASNGSLESLAIDRRGAIYTSPEEPDADGFPLWRLSDGAWSLIGTVPRTDKFKAVELDIDDRGRFYLLERHFAGIFGFATRVRRFELAEGSVAALETLVETGPGRHDNLEGLSVWRDAEGGLRLTMISDDNFSFLQSTEFVEYAVPD